MVNQQIKNILFASDLSAEMNQVFAQAVSQALAHSANIVILHVMAENEKAQSRITLWFGEDQYRGIKIEQMQRAKKTLTGKDLESHRIRQAMAGFFGEQEPSSAMSDSPSLIKDIIVKEAHSIADEIVATAREEDCSLIIMGVEPQGFVAGAMGDHVSRKVIKRSSVPVLLVPVLK